MILRAYARNNEAPSERILLVLGTELGSVVLFFFLHADCLSSPLSLFFSPAFIYVINEEDVGD